MADIDIQNLVERKLAEYGDQIVATIREKLIAQGKLATGALVESVQFKVSTSDGIVTLDIVANDYMQWVDQGIRPGGKMPPMDKMIAWVETRGLRPKSSSGIPESKAGLPRTNRSIAFLIGRKIAKEGMKATNIVSSTMEEVNNPVVNDINAIIVEAITEIIGNALQEIANSVNNDVLNMTIKYFR